MPIDQEKLAKLQKLSNTNKVGGTRRKTAKKTNSSSAAAAKDDTKLLSQLAKFKAVTLDNIAEANFFKEDGTVTHFDRVGVQMSQEYNLTAVYGIAQEKKLDEMFPGIIPQLGAEAYMALNQLNEAFKMAEKEEGKGAVPELVEE
ncbi:hypothetical protein KAFR_0H01510 [Kazachstania africana CBS 2517]|uniref:Nascent polypeptide-associated complex subunit beta n=1 Tax=Kazachstania africana (strain ATCC 22294 / BCRC 22015 / CBS 2517 / CECT 1963 / NBRC 1671 / NRRL Y-8276) TaxID=1071382 RepID=H2AZ05_KAZAF|nr:hypothetical protein KAFR_0H01510 [Kazachstania africana CBS 2517]CCF59561.1 hypothetical protein KAFR_0H01510 [Kazachstania africana CBS 2517]